MCMVSKVMKLLEDEEAVGSELQRVKEYLISRIPENEKLAEGILKEGKSLKNCAAFLGKKAQEQYQKSKMKNGCLMVDDTTVYQWAEEYYLTEQTKGSPKRVAESGQPTPKKNYDIFDWMKQNESAAEQETSEPDLSLFQEADQAKQDKTPSQSAPRRKIHDIFDWLDQSESEKEIGLETPDLTLNSPDAESIGTEIKNCWEGQFSLF